MLLVSSVIASRQQIPNLQFSKNVNLTVRTPTIILQSYRLIVTFVIVQSCKNIRESERLNIVYSNLCNSAQFHSICNQFAVFISILQVVLYFDEYGEYFILPHPVIMNSQLPLATSVHYSANW